MNERLSEKNHLINYVIKRLISQLNIVLLGALVFVIGLIISLGNISLTYLGYISSFVLGVVIGSGTVTVKSIAEYVKYKQNKKKTR